MSVRTILFLVSLLTLVWSKSGNPFEGADLYVNPSYIEEVEYSIVNHPSLAPLLKKAQNISVAYWIDRMSKIKNMTHVLNGAQNQQKLTGHKVLTTIVIYDLPDRDCSAAASNGEIHCQDSQCVNGLNLYKMHYIDPIVSILKNYPNQPIVAIIEPDSLPNLATNLGVPKCTQAQIAYKNGIAYAINQLSTLDNVWMYVDAAHGGWLGWTNNMEKAANIFAEVLKMAGGAQKIRGFSTNVANYQPLGSLTSTADPCNLKSQYNPCINEAIYASKLKTELTNVGITDIAFITDTSRNGVTNMRSDCSNWCNIKGAGLGQRPTTNTAGVVGEDIFDAFYWVKVPGESDGTSNTSSSRYDFHCGSVDSIIPAPQAGDWFDTDFVALCQNAVPPL